MSQLRVSVSEATYSFFPTNLQRQLRQSILITFGENHIISYIPGNIVWHISQVNFTECHFTCFTEAAILPFQWSLFLILESCKDIEVDDYVSMQCFRSTIFVSLNDLRPHVWRTWVVEYSVDTYIWLVNSKSCSWEWTSKDARFDEIRARAWSINTIFREF